jgi:ABC-2 type transport system permease protein
VLRAVFLEGVDMSVLWPEFVSMAALGLAMLALSVMRFRKSLD